MSDDKLFVDSRTGKKYRVKMTQWDKDENCCELCSFTRTLEDNNTGCPMDSSGKLMECIILEVDNNIIGSDYYFEKVKDEVE